MLRPRGGCGGASLQSCRGRPLLPGERPQALQAVATVEGLEDGGRRPLHELHGQGRRSDRRGEPLQQWGPLAMGWERRPCQFGQAGIELPYGFSRLLGPRVESLQHDLLRFLWLHHERQGLVHFFKGSPAAPRRLPGIGTPAAVNSSTAVVPVRGCRHGLPTMTGSHRLPGGAGTGQKGCVTVCVKSGVGGVVLSSGVANSGGGFFSSAWGCTVGGEYRLGMLI